MASYLMSMGTDDAKTGIMREYGRIALLALSAVVLSSATIIYYNHKMYDELAADAYNIFELAAINLMPYMISAVVATITTVAVMSMLPMVRSQQATQVIHRRVKRLADGDLTTTSRLECNNPHLKDVAGELNYAIGFINSSVARWKIINRQQWDLLESIRHATLNKDHWRALKLIEKMEENWKLTATIENRFRT
jgi:hypothetical protein